LSVSRVTENMMWTALLFVVYLARPSRAITETLSGEASGQSLSIDCGSDTVQIVSSSYGLNCNTLLFNNQLTTLKAACSGLSSCSYSVDHTVIGDPSVGCAKEYEYQYECLSDVQEGTVGSEASGQSLSIDCTGSAIRVLEASYGKNCNSGLYNNQLANLEDACNGRETCDYSVNHGVIGDPAVGCGKTYVYQYECDADLQSGSVMEGSAFSMDCGFDAIEIVSATYGLNCDTELYNNARAWLENACSGKSVCSYTASNNLNGDPAGGCWKSYTYSYECKSDCVDEDCSDGNICNGEETCIDGECVSPNDFECPSGFLCSSERARCVRDCSLFAIDGYLRDCSEEFDEVKSEAADAAEVMSTIYSAVEVLQTTTSSLSDNVDDINGIIGGEQENWASSTSILDQLAVLNELLTQVEELTTELASTQAQLDSLQTVVEAFAPNFDQGENVDNSFTSPDEVNAGAAGVVPDTSGWHLDYNWIEIGIVLAIILLTVNAVICIQNVCCSASRKTRRYQRVARYSSANEDENVKINQ